MEEETICYKRAVGGDYKDVSNAFHLYDEKGIRENARQLKEAFSGIRDIKEYFAVKGYA